ncbi:hypothetical protein [Pedobacter jamesrossensis]|uniref:hypothetical protein n=1 Tax=Pedobacter jamesrossensis TaxID=1908238 RepID=UPI0036117488
MKINTLNQKNNIKKYKKFKQNKRADHFIYDTAPLKESNFNIYRFAEQFTQSV